MSNTRKRFAQLLSFLTRAVSHHVSRGVFRVGSVTDNYLMTPEKKGLLRITTTSEPALKEIHRGIPYTVYNPKKMWQTQDSPAEGNEAEAKTPSCEMFHNLFADRRNPITWLESIYRVSQETGVTVYYGITGFGDDSLEGSTSDRSLGDALRWIDEHYS